MREPRTSLTGLALCFFLGCGGNGSNGGDPSSSQGGSGNSGGAGIESYPKACSDLYDPNKVPRFELEMAPTDLAQLDADCAAKAKVYRPATLKYGDETVSVMVRLKGNWSWRCEKKQFLISFNETDPNGRFHGLRKIVLDAPWYEPTLIAERLGFSFMQRFGVSASCVNNATLWLNGEYYGAYANVERLDKEYLQRHFPDLEADGNLYDGGVELRTNETVADVSRRDALIAARDIPSIDNLADLDEVVKVWAGSAMLPDPDSYWAGVEINYYLYDHPTRGFLWLPYDMDMTLLVGRTDESTSTVHIGEVDGLVNADPFTYQNPVWIREPLFQAVLSDTHWCSRFLEELKRARDAYDVSLMTSQIDTWANQIASVVSEDPNKPFSNQDHLYAIATMKATMPKRLAFIDNWLQTAHCPVVSWP